MEKRPLSFRSSRRGDQEATLRQSVALSETTLSTGDLTAAVESWLLDGEYRLLSPATIAARRFVTSKLLWFLRDRELVSCGARELKQFIAYVSRGQAAD